MIKNQIEVAKTAHFYTYNQLETASHILYVIHGYAQLASDFIYEFKYLKGRNTFVIAPEGLSTFYGRERTPVASWMTSHERLDEIKDQLKYLDQLHQSQTAKTNKPILILAFSQGVSTAMRWIAQSKVLNRVDLLLCSGSIPEELLRSEDLSRKIRSLHYFYGDQDRLMKPDLAEKAIQKLQLLGLEHRYVPFEGRHEVSEACHQAIRTLTKFS